jgi:DNA-binding CsgD family transcriptional regulator
MTVSTELPAEIPTADAMAVYVYAMRHGGIDAGDPTLAAELDLPSEAIEAALAQLNDLRLLREECNAGWWRLVPVSPEVAAASLISPIGEEIHRRHAAISRIQGRLNMFQPHYDANRDTVPSHGEGVETLRDAIELSGKLHLAAERCRKEFAGFRPNGLLPLERIAELAGRGVAVRLLLQHSLRSDLRARAALKEIVAAGGEVRTTSRLPRQVVIVDDDTAFLLDDTGASGTVGVVVRHEETVRLLRDVVEVSWESAQPYEAGELGYHEVADDMKRTVVGLLAEGLTDEVIARRLGVSVRTCRRHIATVLSGLGAVSRFQAGVLAASAGLLEPHQSLDG